MTVMHIKGYWKNLFCITTTLIMTVLFSNELPVKLLGLVQSRNT